MLRDELHATAALAMLDLEDQEKVEASVSQMLEYFAKMMEIDVEALEPTTHALVKENRVRDDVVRATLNPDELLARAPHREDRFFKIPSVL
jgi:aspartyl-tRNA(Asn)/glutamyl-tRNA(Gln) amidotransferase subunit C